MAEQRKRTSSSRSGGSKRTTKASSSRSAAKSTSRPAAARKGSAPARKGAAAGSAAARKKAASKPGKAGARKRTAQKTARRGASAAAAPAEFSGKSVAEFRDALTRNLIRPFEMVMLTRDRIQEVVDDAVRRGRMTADDAEDVVRGLVDRGRRQTDDVLRDLEGLLGRGQRARRQVGDATTRARKRALQTADPLIAQADRARRAARVGPAFPITGYDELTAAQVQGRLGSLNAAELRKVRDYERRNANRKSVLSAIEAKLA